MKEEQRHPISVLIADDHPIPRDAFAKSLKELGINVVGQVSSPEDVLGMYEDLRPDVLILDMRFGEQFTGLDAATDLLKVHPDARIVFLSQFDQEILIDRCYHLGAYAFLTKACDGDALLDAVQHAYERQLYFMPSVATRLANKSVRGEKAPLFVLKEQELEIFKLLAKSFTIAEIAAQLGLSVKTVANASIAIKEKLGVNRPGELTLLAVKYKLIEP